MKTILLLLLAGQETPEPAPERPKKPDRGPEIALRLGTELGYDSNILSLSDRDLRQLDDGNRPEKFRIKEADDIILSSWIETAMRLRLLDDPTTLGLRVQAHRYRSSPILNHDEIVLFLRHKPVELEYGLIPDVYRREYLDPETGRFDSAFYREHKIELSLQFG